jgi:hypothetical protein
MVERVEEVMKAAFPGIELDLETMSSGKVTGDAVWAGFDGLDHIDRQKLVRDVLRWNLGENAQEVSILLTFTPVELHSMQEA